MPNRGRGPRRREAGEESGEREREGAGEYGTYCICDSPLCSSSSSPRLTRDPAPAPGDLSLVRMPMQIQHGPLPCAVAEGGESGRKSSSKSGSWWMHVADGVCVDRGTEEEGREEEQMCEVLGVVLS